MPNLKSVHHPDDCWLGVSIGTIDDYLAKHACSRVHLSTALQALYANKRYIDRLPKAVRPFARYELSARIVKQQVSTDGTVKWLLDFDGCAIETVLIPESGRYSLCVSSQVGCAFGCTFCATGKLGLMRNLSCREILEQVVLANNYLTGKGRVTNVVFMGMGEPLHNIDAVVDACDILCHDSAFGLSIHRVTISTVGLVPAIRQLCGRSQVSLALSLHAPNDALRKTLLPIAKKYTIEETLDAVQSYLDTLSSKRQVFIEYTMIAGCNDSVDHARQLAEVLRQVSCKINLIPCNPVIHSSLLSSNERAIESFAKILRNDGYRVTIRQTKGEDIDAACGQLGL